MCVSAMLIGGIISAAGSIFTGMMQGQIAENQGKWQAYQLDVQNKQLEEEKTMVRLQAQKTEADRLEADRRQRSINYAYMATTGLDESMSFTEGADKYNEEAARRDIATLRLGSAYQVNRIADQIAVNTAEKGFVLAKGKATATASMVGGFLNAGASLFSAYGKQSYYAT